jgi:Zn-dependent protease with chaperone function
MDFFGSQDKARKKTGLLVFYMVFAVITIITAIYFIAIFAIAPDDAARSATDAATTYASQGTQPPSLRWDPEIFILVVVGSLLVMGGGSLFKIASLRSGGRVVAQSLGGRLVDPATTDFKERRLMNVVEEMAIAAGMPVPPVYVMDNESGINAFAAGWSDKDAVVAVTRGTLDTLNRDELQGVVGHEFSHVFNGDMRLNIRLMGIIYGLLLVAIIGQILMRVGFFSGGRKKDGAQMGIMAVGVALLVLGYIGVFFGNLIKSAVSRQREYLADAASAQFTRNPKGIADALKKIGGLSDGSKIMAPNAPEASHMFFGDSVSSRFFAAFSTHPPLLDRIKRLDPAFAGEYAQTTALHDEQAGAAAAGAAPAGAAGFAGAAASPGTGAASSRASAFDSAPPQSKAVPSSPWSAPDSRQALHPEHAASAVGEPSESHLEHARALLSALPDAIRDLVHTPLGARGVVYSLLLDPTESTQRKQWQNLAARDPHGANEAERVARHVHALPRELRLPLVELALTGLRKLTPDEYGAFRHGVYELIVADGGVDLFEFAAQRLIIAHLAPTFEMPKRKVARYHSIRPLVADCGVLLSALAHAGKTDRKTTEGAFASGLETLGIAGKASLSAAKRCGIEDIEKAFDRLELGTGAVKKKVVEACTAIVAYDGFVTLEESELLRAVADALGCPMPPLIPTDSPISPV